MTITPQLCTCPQFSACSWIVGQNTIMMPQPLYSPDMAPCNFFIFSKIRKKMKEWWFVNIDEIKTIAEGTKHHSEYCVAEFLRRLEKMLAQVYYTWWGPFWRGQIEYWWTKKDFVRKTKILPGKRETSIPFFSYTHISKASIVSISLSHSHLLYQITAHIVLHLSLPHF